MPTPTYTPLATKTLTATATSVTFSSIGQGFRDLVLVVRGLPNTTIDTLLEINLDTGANYSGVVMVGNGSSAASYTYSGNSIYLDYAAASGATGYVIKADILDYTATDKHKSVLTRASGDSVNAQANRWASTSAINRLRIYTNGGGWVFGIGSTFTLYGIN